MRNLDYKIIFPDLEYQLEQDEEWVIIDFGHKQEKVRLHDYGVIYKIPGLYERIFCKHLKYNSPKMICDMLDDVIEESGYSTRNLRVLDFGAGNGLVGEQIKRKGIDLLVGVDILTEARDAANRDFPGIYDKYYVIDLSQPVDKEMEALKQYGFNALVTVSALGFDDIPPCAFLNAFNLIKDDGYIAFNVKGKYLTDKDDTGYEGIIKDISADNFSVYRRRSYCHRFSLDGKELNYIAIVGKKNKDVNLNELL